MSSPTNAYRSLSLYIFSTYTRVCVCAFFSSHFHRLHFICLIGFCSYFFILLLYLVFGGLWARVIFLVLSMRLLLLFLNLDVVVYVSISALHVFFLSLSLSFFFSCILKLSIKAQTTFNVLQRSAFLVSSRTLIFNLRSLIFVLSLFRFLSLSFLDVWMQRL